MNNVQKKPLLILGVYPESEGYPNIHYRLQDLMAAEAFDITTIHAPVWQQTIFNQKKTAKLAQGWRFCSAHWRMLRAYLKYPTKQTVYVPYPAIFVALLLSYLPKKFQPKHLVLDAFISLYDTIVIDRRLFKPTHPLARLLYAMEQRAFQRCAVAVVDTQQNADYFAQLFCIPRQQFVAIPLSTNEAALNSPPYHLTKQQTVFTVLFIGTLIPLHGLEFILDAIKLLANKPQIQFKIIGSGQLSPVLTAFMQRETVNLTWVKDWYSTEQIQEAIAAADICLGIFGDTAKTQRVCPLKLYLYTACGRAIISADTPCLQTLMGNENAQAIKLVPAGSAAALASAIEELLEQPKLLIEYAQAARFFYQHQLNNQLALKQLLTVLNTQ